MYLFRSKLLHCSFLLLLGAALLFGISSRSPGLAFAAAGLSDPDRREIYLYRRGALAAWAQPFRILVDGQPAGFLANASYVRLPLTPGTHQLQIVPGGLAQITTLQIHANTDGRAFYEFVFPTGWDMRPSFRGAAIEAREESHAIEALRNLSAITAISTAHAAVNRHLTDD
jgi:hypothetical protein